MKHSNGIQRVTLQDIARQTGYSINTVSHALRNKDDIARETRARIQRVAREMGYAPNQLASSLRSGRTRVFAVILGSMSNPFYGIMTDTIQDAAQQAGYTLMIMCSRDNAELEYQLAEQAVSRRVDGILLFPTAHSQPTIRRLREAGMPVVLMFRQIEDAGADSVCCDDTRGARLATDHLIAHGRRRLGYFAHQRIVFSYERRLAGFRQACDEAAIPESDRRFFVFCEDSGSGSLSGDWHASTLKCLRQWRGEGVDGIFVFCDDEAWHVQSVIQQSPDLRDWDVGIVSFDNIQGAQQYPAGLCSVDCNFTAMARQGVDLLRDRIHGDSRPPQSIVCPVRLVCRGSCRPRA